MVLLPLKDEKKSETMLSTKEVVKEMKVTCFYYALVLKRGEEQENLVPPKAIKVLEEFADVTPDELPDGLPSKRDIQHHIDLIPRVNLLNQETHRLNPIEDANLNKQVTKLMQRGLVRESMSLFVVPTLLTPKKDGTWRMCTDIKAINNITINYLYPIPWIEDMMDELVGAMYFNKIDL